MNYYYETPRHPMFMLMEEANLARVRTLRYKDGKLDGVLADWDVPNLQFEFYDERYWNTPYESPFYCLYKKDGEIYQDYRSLWKWAVEESKEYDNVSPSELYDKFMTDAERLNIPIFDSIEEARWYVFGKRKKQ